MFSPERRINTGFVVGNITVSKDTVTGNIGTGGGVSSLYALTDVDISPNIQDRDVIKYDQDSRRWKSGSLDLSVGEFIYISPPEGFISSTLQEIVNEYADVIQQHTETLETVSTTITNTVQVGVLGQPSGVATLDQGGKIPVTQIPSLATTDTFKSQNQSGMLTLQAQRGDICVREDLNKTYVLRQEPASVLENWQELLATGVYEGIGEGLVKVTTQDMFPNYLFDKIEAGANIALEPIDKGNGLITLRISGSGSSGINSPPILSYINPQVIALNEACVINLSAYVVLTDGDPILEYRILSGALPTGLTFDPDTGQIAGTPTVIEEKTVIFVAVDKDGPSNSVTVKFRVSDSLTSGVPPVFATIPAQNIIIDQAYVLNLAPYVSSTDGDPILTYQIIDGELPTGLSLNTLDGRISGKALQTFSGYAVFTASDKDGESNSTSVQFSVTTGIIAGVPPILEAIPNQMLWARLPYTFNLNIYAVRTDNDPILEYRIVSGNLPSGLNLIPETGEIVGTPTEEFTGTVTFVAVDKDGPSNARHVSFVVTEDYDYGTFSNPTGIEIDYGTFSQPNLSAPQLDFGVFDSSLEPYDFGTFDFPTGVDIDYGTFDTPNLNAPQLDFGNMD